MLGEIVTHIRFGAGRVTAFEPPRLEITFEDGAVRAFAYPQAVGRFIRFERPEAEERARRDREDAGATARETDMARLMESRRRAEEDTRLRLEAIHEKRLTAARRAAARSALARKGK